MISLGRNRRVVRSKGTNRWHSEANQSVRRQPSALSVVLHAARRLTRRVQRLSEDARSRALSRFGRSDTPSRFRLPTAVLIWVALATVASCLTLVALRSDLTRVRYELSQASVELRQLDEERRTLTLRLRELHDPRRLSEIARARGFGPPERIVELP